MKPTREQILAEPAGRQLNRWVGEYVMGCREEEDECGLYSLIVPGGVNQLDFCNPGACWSAVPKYSEEIGPAWQVVEKMAKRHTQDFYFGWKIADGCDWRFGFDLKSDHCFTEYGVSAESAPEAISKAALLAILENQ